MRINKVDNVFQVYNKNTGVKKVNSSNNKDADRLKLSEEALDFQFALQKLNNVGDIRWKRQKILKTKLKQAYIKSTMKRLQKRSWKLIILTKEFNGW